MIAMILPNKDRIWYLSDSIREQKTVPMYVYTHIYT